MQESQKKPDIIEYRLTKGDAVTIKNPRNKNNGRYGEVAVVFKSGPLTGKVMVQFGGSTVCFVEWEVVRLLDIKSEPVKNIITGHVGHGYVDCALNKEKKI